MLLSAHLESIDYFNRNDSMAKKNKKKSQAGRSSQVVAALASLSETKDSQAGGSKEKSLAVSVDGGVAASSKEGKKAGAKKKNLAPRSEEGGSKEKSLAVKDDGEVNEHAKLIARINELKNENRVLKNAYFPREDEDEPSESSLDISNRSSLSTSNRWAARLSGQSQAAAEDQEKRLKQELESEKMKIKSVLQQLEDSEASVAKMQEEINRLKKMNAVQTQSIRTLEKSIKSGSDNAEARTVSKLEDELQRGSALLANLYFTQSNRQSLAQRASTIESTNMKEMLASLAEENLDEDPSENIEEEAEAFDQSAFVEKAMQKKQSLWWENLDGIFKYSQYIGDNGDLAEAE